jgi:hypothetical protein
MTLKLEREVFLEALNTVKPALQASGSIVELKKIWFDGDYIYAYNGALGIRLKSKLDLECGINGKVLIGLLQSSSVKEVSLIERPDQLEVKLGRSTTTVVTSRPEQNPWPYPAKLPPGPVGARTLVLTEELLAGLRRVRLVRAAAPKRVEHYGVILFPTKDSLALYTTDSASLAEVVVKVKTAPDLAKTVFPHEFVTQLLNFKPGAKISLLKDAIVVQDEQLQVCSNLLDSSTVHDLPKLVTEAVTGQEKRSPLPESLIEGLERADVLASGMDTPAYVALDVTKKELEVTGDFYHGRLNERYPLTGAAEGRMSVSLPRLKSLAREAEAFAIAKRALVLFGENDARFLIAQHEAHKK